MNWTIATSNRISNAVVLTWLVVAVLFSATPAVELSWQAQLGATYDDNLFCYSATDIDRFERRVAPEQFPIQTIDDVDLNAIFVLTARYRLQSRAGSVRVRTTVHHYVANTSKSYSLGEVAVRQEFWRDGVVNLEYRYLPNYLLRFYRRRDGMASDYAACRFAEHLARIRLRQRLGWFAVVPSYGFEIDDYVAVFDYYDTRAHRPALGLEWELSWGVVFSAGYELKLARAAGPVPDISYRQHEGRLELEYRPWQLRRLSVATEFTLAKRQFTTKEVAIDPAHAGRTDLIGGVGVEVRYRIGQAAVVVAYQYENRSTDSPNKATIEEIKQYAANRFSLGVVVESRKVN